MSMFPLQTTAEGASAEASTNLDPTEMMGIAQEFLITYGPRVVGALIILILGFMVAGMLRRIVRSGCDKAKMDPTLGIFFGNMTRTVTIIIVVIICLSTCGAEVTSLAAILAAAGFAVGMALQGSLSNFAAGVMLLINRPFKVDDVVEVAGVLGKVIEIQLFATIIDTPDNRRYTVPNGSIFGAVIKNMTHHGHVRVEVPVGASYSADIPATRKALEEAAQNCPGRLDDPAFAVVLAELGASSVDWKVRVWSPTADFFTVREALVEGVKRSLDNAGISIPFPQRDVHLYKVD